MSGEEDANSWRKLQGNWFEKNRFFLYVCSICGRWLISKVFIQKDPDICCGEAMVDIIVLHNRLKHTEEKLGETEELLKPFLLSRESDIALEIEDFGGLKPLFSLLLGREPREGA